jgi:hypothetical protein
MTNKLREPIIEEDEVEQKIIVEEKSVREIPDNYLFKYLGSIFNAESATTAVPFLLFIALLGMIYIANLNLAEKNIRDIDKITKQVKELSWDYKTTKADLAFKSTLTEVAKRADTLGLKTSVQPPQKLTSEEVQDDH